MRAERMVAIVLLLQTHEQLTVSELARRLEVSERTVRRDLDALLNAGVPIYSQRGRGGGWALLNGHRINLTALTDEEAGALLLVAGPELLAGLGIERGVTSALRKLVAALPEATRARAAAVRRVIHVDPTRWGAEAEEAPPALADLRAAVVAGHQLDLSYAKPEHPASVRRVHPHGLVFKVGAWYLVAGTEAGIRTFRVSRVVDVVPTTEPIERAADFDLVQAWELLNRDMPNWPGQVRVEFLAQRDAVDAVIGHLGKGYHLESLDDTRNGGRRFSAAFPSVSAAACDLIYLGGGIRVVQPAAVRAELARIGSELVSAYGDRGGKA